MRVFTLLRAAVNEVFCEHCDYWSTMLLPHFFVIKHFSVHRDYSSCFDHNRNVASPSTLLVASFSGCLAFYSMELSSGNTATYMTYYFIIFSDLIKS